jgi:phage tail tape-measure protein
MQSEDAEYLRDTVGDVLAKGVAATISASPTDPVQFLGEWLHKHVDNVRVADDLQRLRTKQAEQKAAADEQLIAAHKSQQAVQEAKKAAIQEVRCSAAPVRG